MKNIFVKKYQLINILISIGMLILLMFIQIHYENKNFDFQQKLIAILGTITMFYIMGSLLLILKRIDYFILFVAVGYFFMFGQQFLYLINMPTTRMTLTSNILSDEALYKTGFIVMNSFLLLYIGYLFTLYSRPEQVKIPSGIKVEIEKKKVMCAGIIVFIVTVVPTLYTLLTNIYLNRLIGYSERILNSLYRKSGLSNLPGILSFYMVPALLAMNIAKDKKQKWPGVLLIIYIVLYVMSASRINAFIILITMFYVYSAIHQEFQWKKMFKVAVFIGFALISFSFVSEMRAGRGISSDNIISKVVSEAGYTFCATAAVVDYCPEVEEHIWGKSYLSALAYVLPNGVTGNYYAKVLGVDEVFQGYLAIYGGGIGSSFIAEAFYNFGKLSYIVMIIFGYLFGIMCKKIEQGIVSGNFRKIYLYTSIFAIIIFYIRSDTRTFFRNFIWFYLPVYLLSGMVTEKESNAIRKLRLLGNLRTRDLDKKD